MTDTIKKFNCGFTQVANKILYNNQLSLKDKGLYAYLISKPEDWEFHTKAMQNELNEGRDSILKCLNNLINAGLIVRNQKRDSQGRLSGTEFEFINPYEERIPHTEKPDTDKPDTENPTVTNIYNSNKEDSNYRDSFEKFWKTYPARKNGKENVYKKYCKVLKEKKYSSNDLQLAIELYRKETEKDNFKYCCNVDKWFNQQYYVGLLAQNNTAQVNTDYDFEKDNIPTNFKDDSNYVSEEELEKRREEWFN